jgi:PBP1b-binding outer membrane lipoprotein LpoB
MKLKSVFAVLFCIVILSGCKAGKIEKNPKIKSDIPIVSESSDKLA